MEQVRTETNTEVAGPDPSFRNPGPSQPSFLVALIDPGHVFRTPDEVVGHPRFTDEEKRTVLLSWARDELVVEQVASKVMPDLKLKSRADEVIKALAVYDPSAAGEYTSAVATMRAGLKSRRRDRSRAH